MDAPLIGLLDVLQKSFSLFLLFLKMGLCFMKIVYCLETNLAYKI